MLRMVIHYLCGSTGIENCCKGKCDKLLYDFSAQSGKSTNVARKIVGENGTHGRK
jgi:hypothetical protein